MKYHARLNELKNIRSSHVNALVLKIITILIEILLDVYQALNNF